MKKNASRKKSRRSKIKKITLNYGNEDPKAFLGEADIPRGLYCIDCPFWNKEQGQAMCEFLNTFDEVLRYKHKICDLNVGYA